MTEKSSLEQRYSDIEENLKEIEEKLAAAAAASGRRREAVRLMAVTKTVEPVFINHALSLGIDLIGENKVQELLSKTDLLSDPKPEMHIIGHLQSNKVRKIVDVVSMIQSVDSLSLADEISRQATLRDKTVQILLEVNIGGEEAKTGFSVDALLPAAEAITEKPGIEIRGLMCVPPICPEDEARRYFARTRALYEKLVPIAGGRVDTLSMGMSADYAAAVEEGATLVRIGSALFGARRY